MGQCKFGAVLQLNDFDDHYALVIRFAGDSPGEDQSPWPRDLAILPYVIDLLALTAHEEGKGASDARVDRDAQHFFFTDRGAEHPFADDFGVEAGVEDALRRYAEATADPDFDSGFIVDHGLAQRRP